MEDIDRWSFLWENPDDFLIVTNSSIMPQDDFGMIFDKHDRLYFLIEDDNLVRLLVSRMRQARVQTVDSRDFRPEPPDSVQLIEEGLASGMSRDEINRRLKLLERRRKDLVTSRRR